MNTPTVSTLDAKLLFGRPMPAIAMPPVAPQPKRPARQFIPAAAKGPRVEIITPPAPLATGASDEERAANRAHQELSSSMANIYAHIRNYRATIARALTPETMALIGPDDIAAVQRFLAESRIVLNNAMPGAVP